MLKNKWTGMGVVLVLVSLLAASVIPFVMAEGEEQISCNVTTGYYSVTLDRDYVEYGFMEENAEKVDPAGTINATNDGGLLEDIMIYGLHATYSAGGTPAPTWNIGSSPGSMVYKHTFNKGTGETSLTDEYQSLADDISSGNKVGFTLKLYTPSEISPYGAYDFSVYVVAIEPEA